MRRYRSTSYYSTTIYLDGAKGGLDSKKDFKDTKRQLAAIAILVTWLDLIA
jgi:hypothetical protein